MGWVYILRCADGSYYVGSTSDLQTRMDQHGQGKGSAYTSKRMPVELVWCQEFESIAQAYAAEKKLQGWSRAKREALIAGQTELLSSLSRRGGLGIRRDDPRADGVS